MGKKIDRFVLTSFMAAGLYFYFGAAFQNHKLAFVLALLSCAVIHKIFSRIQQWFENTAWKQKRNLLRSSSGVLMHFASMNEDEAHETISRLLQAAYGWDAPISLELLHPSMQLSNGNIFKAWRANRSLEKLVICTTGKCPAEAKLFASTFKSPKVALVDSAVLSQLIAEHPEQCFFADTENKSYRPQLKRIAHLVFNRRNVPRGLIFATSMLVMYVFSANIYYLAASLFLLFVTLVSLRRRNRPAKLF